MLAAVAGTAGRRAVIFPGVLPVRSPLPVALHRQGLIKRYEDVLAVDGLDLSVARGECFVARSP